MQRDYHHPFDPYPIQRQFMDAVYDCLQQGHVGIFESPTGTAHLLGQGKSLSLICGSLTWLRDHKRRLLEQSLQADADDDEPDWILEHERKQKHQRLVQERAEVDARLQKIREKEERARLRYENGEPPHKKIRTGPSDAGHGTDSEAAFLLDDYESDDSASSSKGDSATLGLSAETRAMIKQLGLDPSDKDEQKLELDDELKIFFCSRTHSQLSQFVHELRRVKMPSAVPEVESQIDTKENDLNFEQIKHITLGSRKTLCINDKVKALGSATAINDRCLELQQSGTAPHSKCSFLPNKDNEVLVNDFRDHSLASIRDIEDFGRLGKKLQICPYYAARAAVRPAEIVTLPYPLLLQKAAREALNISLKDHIVIVDEAHNLMDAIASIHSVSISASQIDDARAQLVFYLQKFRNRLKGKNRSYIAQLLRVLDSIIAFVKTKSTSSKNVDENVQVGDLLSTKNVDQINLFKLMKYLQESKLAHKVDGYQDFVEGQDVKNVARKKSGSLPVLTHFQSFLAALTNPAPEGRFFLARPDSDQDKLVLKYMLLDPTESFREVVQDARAVILAGGTMSPMSDYMANLFSYLPQEHIQTLSCGHVIPSSNLLASAISTGPTGKEFDFTFAKRNSTAMLDELGLAILQFAQIIPDGLVVFFPSYAYLDTAVERWRTAKSAPQQQTIWTTLERQKKVFVEPKSLVSSAVNANAATKDATPVTTTSRSKATAVESTLAAYSREIDAGGKGALLLAVIGGSLSEGINFSDRLGRGVAVVGLPFANHDSPEWRARLDFVRRRHGAGAAAAAVASAADRDAAAREHYENACMRQVNQAVGRAIRHRGDYAAVLLLDRRYGRASIAGKLPGWMRASLAGDGGGFGATLGRVRDFFDQHDG